MCGAMLTVHGVGPVASGGKVAKMRSTGANGAVQGRERERDGGEVQDQQPVMDPLSQVGRLSKTARSRAN